MNISRCIHRRAIEADENKPKLQKNPELGRKGGAETAYDFFYHITARVNHWDAIITNHSPNWEKQDDKEN